MIFDFLESFNKEVIGNFFENSGYKEQKYPSYFKGTICKELIILPKKLE